jgi:hypothetical protein
LKLRSAIDFTAMSYGEHRDRMTEVVKADTIVAYAETQFRRLNILQAFDVTFTAGCKTSK